MLRYLVALTPRLDKDGDTGSGGGGGEEVPSWGKELQEQMKKLTTAGTSPGEAAQQIPGTQPPKEDQQPPISQEQQQPPAESKKSKSFLDWLMG